MQILIIGATGFIGRALVKELSDAGHQLIAVSRDAKKAGKILGSQIQIATWDGLSAEMLSTHLTGVDAIVNLAGENIAAKRWTAKRKRELSDSRIITGKRISEAIAQAAKKPKVLIQGSATGIYGNQVNEAADEDQEPGNGFLADLTKKWEDSIDLDLIDSVRLVFIRTGLVIGEHGGLMEKMLLPFRFYAGTVLGSGKQWMSWIHIRDQVRAIRFLIENDFCHGPYNLTAPEPVQMNDFIKELGRTISRPAWLKVPAVILKAALGEMAEETVLASQYLLPGNLTRAGFEFDFPVLRETFADILIKTRTNED